MIANMIMIKTLRIAPLIPSHLTKPTTIPINVTGKNKHPAQHDQPSNQLISALNNNHTSFLR